jgi:hypothetical protein
MEWGILIVIIFGFIGISGAFQKIDAKIDANISELESRIEDLENIINPDDDEPDYTV